MTEFEKEIALIEKMGLKTSPLRLEYEKKVYELQSMPEKLKAEGSTEDQIARALHEKRMVKSGPNRNQSWLIGTKAGLCGT